MEFLYAAYPWIKAVHIIAVISWMAGIFYLPRLFVHHTEQVTVGSETDVLFQMMERKLLKVIMTPAMLVTWACGLFMAALPGIIDWAAVWPWLKLISICAMTWFHMWLAARRKDFVEQKNDRTGKTFRIMNEVPTILLVVIVISVVVRPI
ncbi:MAG: protoporphyrinogen oxidase HemJ [Pseudomonadota bacterium]